MKKKFFAAVLILVLLLQTVSFAHWADPYCTVLQENQIMFGDDQGFRADDPLLRCEFAAMLNRAFSFSVKSSADMPDVPQNAWYYRDCAVLYNAGVLTGDENKNINPEQTVTRAEMAVMLSRAMGYTVSNKKSPNPEDVPNWAYGAVLTLTDMNLLSGYPDGTFRGNNNLLRGEAAAVLSKVLEAGSFSGGNGTISNPYRITKPEQFALMNINLTASYRLMCDVVFDEIPMPVIGSADKPFNGTFDGGFYRIIAKKSQGAENVLFRSIGDSGMVTKVRLLCPEQRMAICNTNYGKITLCANTSFANGTPDYVQKFGGVAYENYGKIDKCYNTSAVIALDGGYTSGGIAGYNKGTISNSFNTGSVMAGCGAITGENAGEIRDCYTVNGKISVTGKGKTENVYSGKDAADVFKAEAFSAQTRVLGIIDFHYTGNENFELYAGGEGVSDNPYRIENVLQFKNISQNKEAEFIQTADLSGVSESIAQFLGVYDGNGYSIKTVRLQADGEVALFAENGGELRNIRITDGAIQSKTLAAGLVVNNRGIVENCSFYGSISGENSAGLVLYNKEYGKVNACYTSGRIEAGNIAAGLVFLNDGTVTNGYSAAEVLGICPIGVVYQNNGTITNVYFSGTFSQNGIGLIYENNGIAKYGYTFYEPIVAVNNGTTEYVVTAAEIQMRNPEMYFGFDLARVWEKSSDTQYPYPVLVENPHYLVVRTENYTEFAGGDGGANDPYKIVTPNHLANVAKHPDAHFVLMNDVNVSEMDAQKENILVADVFYGSFDGNRNQIIGLNENKTLFGENYGTVARLYIKNATLNGENIAPLVQKNYGKILNCSFSGNITAENGAGLVWENFGEISLCNSDGNFNGTNLAGIVLYNRNNVSECVSSARMQGDNLFGLAQNDGGTVADSWFGGYLCGQTIYPTSQKNTRNCYYLNYYGKTDAEGKNVEEFQKLGSRFGENWTQKDGYPVLKNMPLLTLPLLNMEGDGSAENPYKIRETEQLKYLGMYADKHFKVIQNVKAQNVLLNPVETFNGTIDGNQKMITGLEIYGKKAGLILKLEGKIQNLILTDIKVEGVEETGAFAAINSGVLENCVVRTGRIGTLGSFAGGLCGENAGDGLVYGCENNGDIFSSNFTGGIAGQNNGTIVLSRNTGGAVTTAQAVAGASGGIAGENNSVIDRCYNNGKIFAYSESEESYAGGIAGVHKNSISNCYNTGEIHSKAKRGAYAGGIAGLGLNKSEVRACYNTGFSNATGDTTYTGSALAKANGGTLYGFVYENTVAEPIGAGNIEESFVHARAIDVMYRKEGYETFDFEKTWGFEYNNGFYIAQLNENPQVYKMPEENLVDFAGGDGSMDNPYRILTPEQLNNVRKYLGATFILLGNIDMSGYCATHEFKPIGDNVFSFYGLFVGGNYTISGLEIAGEEFGLFRENHGEIYNCFFENVSGNGSGGTVAAYNTGLIYNCMQIGNQQVVSDNVNVNRGGLIGVNKNSGMVISSYNAGDISVSGQNVQVGGIAYGNHGVISGTFNSGHISADAKQLSVSGGIAAHNFGIVSDCYSANHVSAVSGTDSNAFAGGIIGNNGGTIVNVYYSGEKVSASNYGSISASNTASVFNCYYLGELGIGRNNGSVQNVIQCNVEQLQKHETFAGFDFENMWIMDASFRYPYPQFIEIAHR